MASNTYKHYPVHGMDPRQHLEHYFSDRPDKDNEEDFLKFPMENLSKTFAKGHIKGDVLIDISVGSFIHHFYAACELFRHIIVLKMKDRCILELKRWLNTRTGAFDWRHTLKMHSNLEGKSDHLQDKEGKVREAAQHIARCDFEKENIVDPLVLPPADCIISSWILDSCCKNQDDYIRYLRKFSGMLKPGGHLILFGVFGATYCTVGKDKLHVLTYDEYFARKALVGEGFIIDNCVVKKKSAVNDLIDYEDIVFIEAHKKKQVKSAC